MIDRHPADRLLPAVHDAIAPDGSEVRLLCSVARASLAHFELGAGEVSRATVHRTVDEMWYVVAGMGTMWRRPRDGEPVEVEMRPGLALTIPVGTTFQFRNTGRIPLAAVGVTVPPWPGDGEAVVVEGPWQPNVG